MVGKAAAGILGSVDRRRDKLEQTAGGMEAGEDVADAAVGKSGTWSQH